ncbi:MAG: acetyl-CoA carboxylase carboxyl transferase subunit alpha, partial [Pseudomonadota bacterium]
QDLLQLGVCDTVVEEPVGGAQRGRDETVARVGRAVQAALDAMDGLSGEELRAERQRRYINTGDRGLN